MGTGNTFVHVWMQWPHNPVVLPLYLQNRRRAWDILLLIRCEPSMTLINPKHIRKQSVTNLISYLFSRGTLCDTSKKSTYNQDIEFNGIYLIH